MADRVINIDYEPFPKQALLHRCNATEILYGGAAGPGKSHALRFDGYHWCLTIPGIQVYLFRRTFPELERTHILSARVEMPEEVAHYNKQQRRLEFHNNGSIMHFCHCQYEDDVFEWLSAEIHILIIDELTTFSSFMYDFLRNRVRCTLDIPPEYRKWIPRIMCGSNPGGIGHVFCKKRWVDFCPPKVPTDQIKSLDDLTMKWAADDEGGMLRCYIPGTLEDNPRILERDPGYKLRVGALPEPYRTAYLTGDWNIFMGQAFEFQDSFPYVIDPIDVPKNAPLYMTYDWGFGAPFSIMWWWVDNDNRLYGFNEWDGWNGEVNKGLRMADSAVARGIREREGAMGISNRPIIRLAGHDCFHKKMDALGGGQGPSTSEVFAAQSIYLTPADPTRHAKIRQFRERLKAPTDSELPMMVVYRTCEQFRRTIPMIQTHPTNVEEIDTKAEDHCFAADTLVQTTTGLYRIEDLVGTSGCVKSINGWTPYDNCRMTQPSADTVKIEFENGSVVVCTPDHEIFTVDGWVRAEALLDTICYTSMDKDYGGITCKSSLYQKLSKNLTALGTISVGLIFKGKALGSIVGFGKRLMDLFQAGTMSIIRIQTNPITNQTTYSCGSDPLTNNSTQNEMTIKCGRQQGNKRQKSGTVALKEKRGTRNIISKIVARCEMVWKSYVGSVELCLLENRGPCIVHGSARQGPGWIGLRKKREFVNSVDRFSRLYGNQVNDAVHSHVQQSYDGVGLRVVKVSLSGAKPVYCLTVPGTHCFFLPNGILVSNCFDSAAQIVMARPMSQPEDRLPESGSKAIIDAVEATTSNYTLESESDLMMDYMNENDPYTSLMMARNEYDDGGTRGTID